MYRLHHFIGYDNREQASTQELAGITAIFTEASQRELFSTLETDPSGSPPDGRLVNLPLIAQI
jgi:hypothetical protein